MIDIFELILSGDEKKVIQFYRNIYDQGVEPKVFINEFLELIYYFKNINFLTLESANFSLNDKEFKKIKEISNNVKNEILIMFWQFTIRTLDELDIVSNQNLSIEMFLMRLIHLDKKDLNIQKIDQKVPSENYGKIDISSDIKNETVDQIKNITQEKKNKPVLQAEDKTEENFSINSFDKLLIICNEKKELQLKYELEKNVNLVNFEKNRIEISFNDNLDKNFVKNLSTKLFEWTGERWIISFSKEKGQESIKEKEKNKKDKIIKETKQMDIYKSVLNKFPDANLIDVITKIEDEN